MFHEKMRASNRLSAPGAAGESSHALAKNGQNRNDNKHAAERRSIVRHLVEIGEDKHPKAQEEDAVRNRVEHRPCTSAVDGVERAKQNGTNA